MKSVAATRLVAGREIKERLDGPLLKILPGLSALIVVALIVIPALLAGRPTNVAMVGPAAEALGPGINATAKALGVPQ
jgi:hypothetical protein